VVSGSRWVGAALLCCCCCGGGGGGGAITLVRLPPSLPPFSSFFSDCSTLTHDFLLCPHHHHYHHLCTYAVVSCWSRVGSAHLPTYLLARSRAHTRAVHRTTAGREGTKNLRCYNTTPHRVDTVDVPCVVGASRKSCRDTDTHFGVGGHNDVGGGASSSGPASIERRC